MTKRFFFLSTLILAMFLTACSNSQPPPSQETKAPGDTVASADNANVVKAEGVLGAIAPPNQAASPPPATSATAAIANGGKVPKIELPVKKLDFGNVREDKKIVKDFVVKNVGKAPLNIESVNPG